MPGTQDYSQLFLPTLQELEIHDFEYLQFIKASNLISLRMLEVKSSEHLQQFLPRRLQSLVIQTSPEHENTLELSPIVLPEIKRLSFVFHNVRWTLTSLPVLTSIHLAYTSGMNFQGNMLCVKLIYHPEMCPSLREIDFGDFVEWDLLLIILKRRNLGRKDVARIEKISIFVPFAFRQSLLDPLLGREQQNGPSNTALSLEETRELICDPSIPGCIECLRNIRPGCRETARPKQPYDPEERLLHPFDMKLDNLFGVFPSVDE
ncbi:hypothetical protein M408DRAFT_28572 [Serendipita vermifera MAFF 305830]|uniref:F-box domain-containing protein n=1 Tax=Serendipita vermifera MAFF 305830 TaxID=933852 RepID=A0A0C3ADA6_SERVB|nr:hypothetical protein M408DRAFT_28572 [Serendipita vermifera MAFF 305830]